MTRILGIICLVLALPLLFFAVFVLWAHQMLTVGVGPGFWLMSAADVVLAYAGVVLLMRAWRQPK